MLRWFGGEAFGNEAFSLPPLLKAFFFQKVLRINSHVSWPVHWSSQIRVPAKIDRGNRNPGMSMGCYLDGRNGIVLGENVWVGPRVSLISMNHDLNDYKRYTQEDPIRIGRDCWLGAGVTILPGVSLRNHTVVAAGSVVTKSFDEENIVIAGVPAKKVKDLSPYGTS